MQEKIPCYEKPERPCYQTKVTPIPPVQKKKEQPVVQEKIPCYEKPERPCYQGKQEATYEKSAPARKKEPVYEESVKVSQTPSKQACYRQVEIIQELPSGTCNEVIT